MIQVEHLSKLYGSFGQYYEQIPMDLVIRSFAQERQARIFNYDPLSTSPDAGAEFDLGRDSVILGGFTEEASSFSATSARSCRMSRWA